MPAPSFPISAFPVLPIPPLAARCWPGPHRRREWPLALLAAALTFAPDADAVARHAPAREAMSTFAFVNAEVAAVADAMATVLGHPIVVDPRVKGTLSLVTGEPVTAARATLLFTEALRGLGFALVHTNGLYKIVPEADAKLQAEVAVLPPSTAGGDRVVTQVIPIQQENAANLVAVLRPLITANNTINVNAGNNSLVITDYASNLARLDAVIAALDTPSATDVEVMPLQHAIAANLAATVLKLSEGAGAAASGANAAGGGAGGTAVIADPQLNALLVRAPNRARLAAIRALVAQLDRPEASGAGSGSVHVVYLQHTDATRLAAVLRAALPSADVLTGTTGGASAAGSSGSSGAGGSNLPSPKGSYGTSSSSSSSTNTSSSSSSSATATPLTAAAAPSTGGYIQADPASNSLIVTAPEPLFRDIRAVIDQLDVRRAQLYVESLVVEVDASRALDVGLQWKTLFNISEASLTTLTLGEVATALRTISGTNILSTANVVTLDNEEARIVVGQNVPYVTGSYTTSSSSTNPFQTVERMDVGVTLHIRPQIGPHGEIRMTVMQESSSVESTSSSQGPTTNKRSIESTVTVQDGRILVLGGLIEDSETRESDNVPVLSAIPVLGALFRSVDKTRKKTNLLVFLRPMVMHDDGQSEALSLDRYDRIRASQAALPRDLDKTLEGAAPPALPALPRSTEAAAKPAQ